MNVRFAREFPSIVRDSLNPHADLLRDLKHKCKLQRCIETYLISTVLTIYINKIYLLYIHSVPAVLQAVVAACERGGASGPHQPRHHGHRRPGHAQGLGQVCR